MTHDRPKAVRFGSMPTSGRPISALALVLLTGLGFRSTAYASSSSTDRTLADPHVGMASIKEVRVVGISEALGLMDLEVELAIPAGDEPVTVSLDLLSKDTTIPVLLVRKLGRGNDRNAIWTARLWMGDQTAPACKLLSASIRVQPTTAGRMPQHLSLDVAKFDATPEPGQATPDWAKGIVWYQILPDRFCNGEATNDPRPGTSPLAGVGSSDVYPMPWNASWSKPSFEELEASLLAQEARRASFGANTPPSMVASRPSGLLGVVLRRRYGGDLQGVVQRTEHLRALGVGGLYLCPIFESPSHHKYDASDHRHVDPTLAVMPGLGKGDDRDWARADASSSAAPPWADTPADQYFLESFLPAMQHAGLRLILDGVWNHVGTSHWAFRDLAVNGSRSPYAAWFNARFDGEGGLDSWKGWDGVRGRLPAFKQTPARELVPPVREHIDAITTRWMAPSTATGRGIDGWRLDVAPEIGVPFWQRWNAHVKSINPQAITIAEVWHEERAYTDVQGEARAFDAQMNYPWARAVCRWLQRPEVYTSEVLGKELERLLERHPATNLVQMNLLGSHDTQRVVSLMQNPMAEFDSGGQMGPGSPGYDRGPPSETARRKAGLAMALLATMEGAPMVYMGDEFGVFGAKDPDCRKPVPWPDLGPYVDPSDGPDLAFLEHCRAWFALRQDPEIGAALRLGRTDVIPTGDPHVLAILRMLNATRVLILVNAGAQPARLDARLADALAAEVLDRTPGEVRADDRHEPRPITLQSHTARVFVLR